VRNATGKLLDDIARKSKGHVQDNRLRVWQDLRFDYDPFGNLVEKKKGAHQTQQFVFDAEDRLVKVITENSRGRSETRFAYDPLGRRIARDVDYRESQQGARTHEHKRFVWQGLRLLQEIRDGGLSNYLYNPDAAYTPLARIDQAFADDKQALAPGSQVFHFHTDLIGTPLEVTNEAGELAWAGNYKAWGKSDHNEDPLLETRIEQPLRFPGQYADDATGLHYNTFRYYDPDIGRFISQDPIGLMGGENLYAYAPNPTGWMDPSGLYNGEGVRDLGVFHTFHKHILEATQYTLSDTEHFRLGNQSVYERAQTDSAFRTLLQSKYPGVLEHVAPTRTGRFRGTSPPNMTWHHGDSPGMLRLVDAGDHAEFHKIYHPDGTGGRNKWGGGTGCR
jgi:RHS repeat-associated protein